MELERNTIAKSATGPVAGFDGGLLSVPPALLATLGEQLAGLSLRLQSESGLSARGRGAMAELEQLGLELQELVRALGLPSHGGEESVDLQQAVKASQPLWHAALQQRGMTLQLMQGDAAHVEIEPVLLQHALDLLIGHGIACGADFCLAALPATPASPAGLRLSGLGAAADALELHWQLLRLLARSRGWRLTRHAAAGSAPNSPASQIELLFGAPPAVAFNDGLPRMHIAQNTRVLVIDPNDLSRVHCAKLLTEGGIAHDVVASVAQAEDALRHGPGGWTAVVSGFALDDAPMQRLAEALQNSLGSLRWIELVDGSHDFAFGTPDGNRPGRIGRADLQHTLLASLAS